MALNEHIGFVEQQLEKELESIKRSTERGYHGSVEEGRKRAHEWSNILVALRSHPGAIPSPPAKHKRKLQLDTEPRLFRVGDWVEVNRDECDFRGPIISLNDTHYPDRPIAVDCRQGNPKHWLVYTGEDSISHVP
jgi:hypothetical protein